MQHPSQHYASLINVSHHNTSHPSSAQSTPAASGMMPTSTPNGSPPAATPGGAQWTMAGGGLFATSNPQGGTFATPSPFIGMAAPPAPAFPNAASLLAQPEFLTLLQQLPADQVMHSLLLLHQQLHQAGGGHAVRHHNGGADASPQLLYSAAGGGLPMMFYQSPNQQQQHQVLPPNSFMPSTMQYAHHLPASPSATSMYGPGGHVTVLYSAPPPSATQMSPMGGVPPRATPPHVGMGVAAPSSSTATPNDGVMPPPAPGDTEPGPRQLIVNYLPVDATDEELTNIFASVGPVEVARIIFDKVTHRTKGFGFVYFKKHVHAVQAVQRLTGLQLRGKRLKVSYAVPQRPVSALLGDEGAGVHTPATGESPQGASNADVAASLGTAQLQPVSLDAFGQLPAARRQRRAVGDADDDDDDEVARPGA